VTNGGHDPLGVLDKMRASISKMTGVLEDLSSDL
jgi:hypothetical protein